MEEIILLPSIKTELEITSTLAFMGLENIFSPFFKEVTAKFL